MADRALSLFVSSQQLPPGGSVLATMEVQGVMISIWRGSGGRDGRGGEGGWGFSPPFPPTCVKENADDIADDENPTSKGQGERGERRRRRGERHAGSSLPPSPLSSFPFHPSSPR